MSMIELESMRRSDCTHLLTYLLFAAQTGPKPVAALFIVLLDVCLTSARVSSYVRVLRRDPRQSAPIYSPPCFTFTFHPAIAPCFL